MNVKDGRISGGLCFVGGYSVHFLMPRPLSALFPALLLWPLLLTPGCSQPDAGSRGPLPEDRFVEAYIALLKNAPAEVRDTLSGSGLRVLDSLGITAEQFRRSVEEYGRDPVRWKAFYADVVRRLEAEKKAVPDSLTSSPERPARAGPSGQ